MNIKSVVENQDRIYNMLKKAHDNDRLSHAYLFYGEKGVGKKEMAYALACLLYCQNGGCFTCDTCKSILDNNHLNVEYIGIDSNKTMISKDQITSLQDDFSKTSLLEGSRLYIVDGIDTATTAAQNSLLKFIEDPTNKTPIIGVFIATDLSNVVSTIQSRCNLIHFDALEITKRINILIDEGFNELDAILISRLTNNVEEAQDIVSDTDYNKVKDLFLQFLDTKNENDSIMFFVKNNSYLNDVKKMRIFLEFLILFLEDSVALKHHNEGLLLKPLYDKIKVYSRKNDKLLEDKLRELLKSFDKLKYNVSPKNVLHEVVTTFN